MKPQIAELNCSTGETTIREMTDEEYAQYLIDTEANKAEENSSE